MNSILISLGAVLVAALTVALVGPSFVDWNAYRAQIEAEGTRLAGRPIAIGGDLDMRILPEPVIEMGKVQVLRAAGAEPLVEAEAASLNLSLAALLLGRIEVTDLTLKAPTVRLVTHDGGLDWGAATPAEGGAVTVFRRIAADDARLEFADPASGLDVKLEGVELQVTGSGAGGPFKIAGHYGAADRQSGERPGFSLTLGTLSPTAPIKIAGRVELDRASQLSLDGQLVSLAEAPGFQGRLRLDRKLDGAAAGGTEAQLTALADADLDLQRGTLDTVRVSLTGAQRPITLAGSATADFEGRPSFRVQITTRQIDFDELAADPGGEALIDDARRAFERTADWLARNDARAEVHVSADGAVVNRELVRGFSAVAELEPEVVHLTALEGSFPGQTSIKLTGRASLGEAPSFAGHVNAETLELGRFAHWAAPEDDAWVEQVFGASRGRLSMNGEVRVDPDKVTLKVLEGFLNQSPFSGELSMARAGDEARQRFSADLAFDRIDLDRYVPAKARLVDLATATGLSAAPDFLLDLKAKRLDWRGRTAEGFDASLAQSGGALEIGRLHIDQFAGTEIDLSGRLVPGADAPTGALDIALKTQDLAAFAEGLGDDMPPLERLAEAAPLALGAADLSLHLEGARPGAAKASSLTAKGSLSGLAVTVAASSDAPPGTAGAGTLALDATVSAASLRAIDGLAGALRLGEDALPVGPGSLELHATGKAADGLEAHARLAALDATATVDGRVAADPPGFTGTVQVEGKSAAVLARVLGLPAPATDGGVAASATATYAAGKLAIDRFTADLSGAALEGSLEAELAVRPVHLRAKLDAARASVPWLAAAIFAPPTRPRSETGEAAEARESAWSTDLVEVDRLGSVALEASGHVGELTLDRDAALTDADYALTIGDTALELASLSGRIGDSKVRLWGHVSGSGEAMLDVGGELSVRDGDLGALLQDSQGRALLAGRAELDGRFTAAGRSLLSLVSSLSGSGKLALSDLAVARFDAGHVLDGAATAPAPAVVDALIEVGRGRTTPLGAASAPVEAVNGRIKIGPVAFAAQPLSGEITSFLDLPSRRFDQELVLQRAGSPGHLALVHAGPLDDIRREAELTGLPLAGTVRWTEPLDGYDPPFAAAGVASAGGEASGGKSDAGGALPSRLIDQRVVDLPILQQVAPTQ